MTIITLPPNPARCRPFWMIYQLETGGWGHHKREHAARRMMRAHPRYKPEIEEESVNEFARGLLWLGLGGVVLAVVLGVIAMVAAWYSRADR